MERSSAMAHILCLNFQELDENLDRCFVAYYFTPLLEIFILLQRRIRGNEMNKGPSTSNNRPSQENNDKQELGCAMRGSIKASQEEIEALLFMHKSAELKKNTGIVQVESAQPKKKKRCVIS